MNPYDPDAALEAIRPRLIAAKARRRRVISASAAVTMLAVSSVAAASVYNPSDDSSSVVAVSPDQAETEPIPTTTTTTTTTASIGPLEQDSHTGGSDEKGAGGGAEKAPPPDPSPSTTKAPTTTTTKAPTTTTTKAPTTTTSPPPATQVVHHTFTYPGTGSVTVAQTGDTLAYVSSSAEDGWTHKLSHDQPDLIGVEFTKDDVQRWLKVKVVNGEAVANQHEHVKCLPPPSTTTHDAPAGAGTMTVQVDGSGELSLSGVNPTDGWTHEVVHEKPEAVKVGFRDGDGTFVWVKVAIHDCELKVQSG